MITAIVCVSKTSASWENLLFPYAKTKAWISWSVTPHLISTFCFRYIDSTVPLLPEPLVVFCGCTARFMSDLVENHEDRFSHDGAQLKKLKELTFKWLLVLLWAWHMWLALWAPTLKTDVKTDVIGSLSFHPENRCKNRCDWLSELPPWKQM